MLVGGISHFAFAAFEHDRHDLRFEMAGLRGAFCAVVAFNGQFILVFACDAPFGGDVFGRHAHVNVLEGVVQCSHHHVDHFGVAHASTKARGQTGIGRAAHVFCTAANGDVGIAQQDRLTGGNNGLQTRAAQAVDVEGGRALGAAPVDGGHAGQVHVFGLGVDHMAKHHMANVFAIDVCTME